MAGTTCRLGLRSGDGKVTGKTTTPLLFRYICYIYTSLPSLPGIISRNSSTSLWLFFSFSLSSPDPQLYQPGAT